MHVQFTNYYWIVLDQYAPLRSLKLSSGIFANNPWTTLTKGSPMDLVDLVRR
jgi:hypothetical protein